MKLLKILLGGLVLFGIWLSLGISTPKPFLQAIDPVDEIQQQIDELAKLKELSENATAPLQSQLNNLDQQIATAQAGITQAQAEATQVANQIDQRELELADQFAIVSVRIAEQYKRWRSSSPLMILFASDSANQLTRDLAYRNSIEAQDERAIENLSKQLEELATQKVALEERQTKLASLQSQLDSQAQFFRVEIAKARDYQQELAGQIATLTQQQQAIINARSGTFTTSIGEVPPADDFNASIAFKPQAPANSFAVFSFGAYTHRNGMSQYGAKARAEQGQSVEEILAAYYPGTQLKKDYSVMNTITVDGVGSIAFEDDYLHKIYEMPASWHPEALKAQAIAARTYAVRRTNNGQSSICTTEACQVFKNSRKGGAWSAAVEATRGWVLVDGSGAPVSTQYASTHGGFSNTSGWDTTDKSGSGDWTTRAWEKIASSPWFYKSWYRQGYSSSGPSCGRAHPWMSEAEMADIINAWLVRKNPNGADLNRIVPITINECAIGGQGGNPYSTDDLKNLANAIGGAVTSISSVSVNHNDRGQTTTVTFQTNRGSIAIPGSEFKETFNLRAPGFIAIPQSSFAFFNIEHKK